MRENKNSTGFVLSKFKMNKDVVAYKWFTDDALGKSLFGPCLGPLEKC